MAAAKEELLQTSAPVAALLGYINIKDVDAKHMVIIPSGEHVEWRTHVVEVSSFAAMMAEVDFLKRDGRFDQIDLLAPKAVQEDPLEKGFVLIGHLRLINGVWNYKTDRGE